MNMTMNNFKKRRSQVLQQLGNAGIAIVISNKEPPQPYAPTPFKQISDFYYLTGFNEPESILVLAPGRPQGEYVLFCREHKPEEEVWTGYRAGQEGACKIYGSDQAFPISAFEDMLSDLLADREAIYTNFGHDLQQEAIIMDTINQMRARRRIGINPPTDMIHIGKITHEMRVHKDEEELALMKKAADISVNAQLRAMKTCRPGLYEYELEAEIMYEYRKSDSFPAFEIIVGGGINACTLHYVEKKSILKDRELVLIDAGAEYKHYSSDIT